jgi:DNA-binding MarR family transcriptional regulator
MKGLVNRLQINISQHDIIAKSRRTAPESRAALKMRKDALQKKEYETLSHFRYQLRRFLRFSEDVTHQHGVTHLQYLLMLHLKGYAEREWATIGELSERLQAHHHGVVSLVSRCEKLGLVYREQGKTDRREVEVHLTPAGEKMVAKLARQHRDELLNLQGIFQVPDVAHLGGKKKS